jgi:uracil-DNA glycosylase family 4
MFDQDQIIELLRFQMEAGADEAIGFEPVDRAKSVAAKVVNSGADIAVRDVRPQQQAGRADARGQAPQAAIHVQTTPVPAKAVSKLESNEAAAASARNLAQAAESLEQLREAVFEFDGCALKQTAMNTVFADGDPASRIMLIGEAPGADEDRQGKPFVGPSGKLLDQMLKAAGINREKAYITNIIFWRPPGNRDPSAAEIAMCRPFVERHIELVSPDVLVFLGGPSAKTMLTRSEGITRMRGRWFDYATPTMIETEAEVIPAMPFFHPAYLLRSPAHKREAWRDLLAICDRIEAANTSS